MFGPHPFDLLMVLTTMLFFFTITQSISDFTRYVRNRMSIQPLSPSSKLLKTFLLLPLKHFTRIMGAKFALQSFLVTHGITHIATPPHTLEHNGYSERQHKHIVKTGLTLLHQASIPLIFWLYAFTTTVYLINRMPKVGLSLGSSFEKLFNKAPNPSKLHVFGCFYFPWSRPYSSHKVDPKSSPCVFLGYSLTQSSFLCFDPSL